MIIQVLFLLMCFWIIFILFIMFKSLLLLYSVYMYDFLNKIRGYTSTYIAKVRSLNIKRIMSSEEIEMFDCLVCWQTQPIDWAVECNEFNFFQDELEDLSTDSETDTDDSDNDDFEHINKFSKKYSDKSNLNITADKPKINHKFCADCVRGLVEAACVDAPLAKGGVGLPCMENGCNNVLLLSEIRKLIPKDQLNRLEERIQHEVIAKAKIKNLERCLKCNYGQIMRTRPSQRRNLKFVCRECSESHCRLCKLPWKKLHARKTCWQYKWALAYRHGWDQTVTPEYVDSEIAEKLTENIVRKCHQCGISFMKSNGCNKMVCRCGATQCYCCRQKDITYDHFCNCSAVKKGKCCNKCYLFDNVKAKERKERDDILRVAKRHHDIHETSSETSMKMTTPKRHQKNESKKHTPKSQEEIS